MSTPVTASPSAPEGSRRSTLASTVKLGAIAGAVFGTWDLFFTWIDPLADDTPVALLSFYGPMFAVWSAAGFAAYRRSGRITESIKVGATVAFVTFAVFHIFVFARINIFLDEIRGRLDWGNTVATYPSSGFESLRAYANYIFVTGAPFKMLVATTIGTVFGVIGGLLARLTGTAARQLPHNHASAS